ncbi:Beta-xylosidase [Butyrivibrio fibrisolvens 16/4]|nr:Beta-xylosidase [Butyrivibrio fibrisolvens 16/4]
MSELNNDLTGINKNGLNQLLFSTPNADDGIMLRCEGCRAYVKNGYIYLSFIEWPKEGISNSRRRQVCYRSKNLLGPYERKVIFDDDMGYFNRGIAQGVFIENDNNKWYAMLFQDHGAVGRIPYLIPMKWENDWPVIGIEGRAPAEFEIDIEECKTKSLVTSDAFNYSENKLPLQFQWNHNPLYDAWSFTERKGYLRLKNKQLATNILNARNTLTERTVTPKSVYTIEGDFSNLKNGDIAGICAFMGNYGMIGITKDEEKFFVYFRLFNGEEKRFKCSNIKGFNCKSFWLRIVFDFENQDKAFFYYSCDGKVFISMDDILNMEFTLDVFVGYRLGIFSFPTKEIGGYTDFRNLVFE